MLQVRIEVPLGINYFFPLKELEDHAWFPASLRNFQTDFIGFVVMKLDVYCVFIQQLKKLGLPAQPMFDLCSGSGEPAISIFRKSNCFRNLILSDKFPGVTQSSDQRITYIRNSTDVLHMEFQKDVCYTMFNAFHHFTDEEKNTIVQKIQSSGSRAFFVEILEPTIICFSKVFFLTIFGSLVFTPFLKPFSFKRLFFTYIIPINIFTIFFDGMISVFKSRSLKQYRNLFPGETIEINKFRKGISSLIIIHLLPKK